MIFCGAYFSNVLLTKCAKSSSHCDVRKLTSLEQFARLRFVFKLIRFFRSDSDFDVIVFAVVRLKLMSNISQAIASVGIEPVARRFFQIIARSLEKMMEIIGAILELGAAVGLGEGQSGPRDYFQSLEVAIQTSNSQTAVRGPCTCKTCLKLSRRG